ncbi:MAG: peptidylprolyl isomerase [Gallionella sp.]
MKMKAILACCSLLALPVYALAATQLAENLFTPTSQQQVGVIDTIAAVINDDVITRYELGERLRMVVGQLKRQDIPLPPTSVLERQLLERLVMDMLQVQFARQSGIRVDDTQLNLAITRIGQQNGFSSLPKFRGKLESDGIEYKHFREEIRNEIIFTRLREREVESKIAISETEVDNYLANKARLGSAGEEFHLAHMLVLVPENASAMNIQEARNKAGRALSQLKGGADFAQVAASFSDAEDALKGGDLGWRTSNRIPPLFMNALQTMQSGQTTEILRSPNGFHILRLIEKRSGDVPIVITQTHTRHILIKTSEIVSESEARKRVMEIKQRIENGADFAEQARRYSQDGSAQQGGDLDWISPGDTVPEFEGKMNKLQLNEVGAVRSQFGWHLIEVLERRSADVSDQQKRQQARVAIGTFKSEEQYQDWQRQLRDRSFVEYRLEETK